MTEAAPKKPIIFYIMRHGQTEDNLAGLSSGMGRNPQLTEEGSAGVERVIPVVEQLDPAPTVAVSSDLDRARDTADIVTSTLKNVRRLPHDEALGEMFLGDDEGLDERTRPERLLKVIKEGDGWGRKIEGVPSEVVEKLEQLVAHIKAGTLPADMNPIAIENEVHRYDRRGSTGLWEPVENHRLRIADAIQHAVRGDSGTEHNIPLVVCHAGSVRRMLEMAGLPHSVGVKNAAIYKFVQDDTAPKGWRIYSMSVDEQRALQTTEIPIPQQAAVEAAKR
ncbi:MAG: histidine phosphatase family protein [Rickettsiales bacterium]|nr:histidine phosphatase family protein [Rickettsiales bacterium]